MWKNTALPNTNLTEDKMAFMSTLNEIKIKQVRSLIQAGNLVTQLQRMDEIVKIWSFECVFSLKIKNLVENELISFLLTFPCSLSSFVRFNSSFVN